ncbi:hypothetical protein BVRB_025950, partial [Beta vulgaris subsp. vulgaris]
MSDNDGDVVKCIMPLDTVIRLACPESAILLIPRELPIESGTWGYPVRFD